MSDFWMHAQFGSEHASSKQDEGKRKEALQRLKNVTKTLIALSIDSAALPAEDVNEFCSALDSILLHKIRDKDAISTSKGTREATDLNAAAARFWEFLMNSFGEKAKRVSLMKSKEKPSQGSVANLRVLESLDRDMTLSHCPTARSKVRAWILQSLNMNALALCITAVLAEKKVADLYTEKAFMRNHESTSLLRSMIMGLDPIQFQVPIVEVIYQADVNTKGTTTNRSFYSSSSSAQPKSNLAAASFTAMLQQQEKSKGSTTTKKKKRRKKPAVRLVTDIDDEQQNGDANVKVKHVGETIDYMNSPDLQTITDATSPTPISNSPSPARDIAAEDGDSGVNQSGLNEKVKSDKGSSVSKSQGWDIDSTPSRTQTSDENEAGLVTGKKPSLSHSENTSHSQSGSSASTSPAQQQRTKERSYPSSPSAFADVIKRVKSSAVVKRFSSASEMEETPAAVNSPQVEQSRTPSPPPTAALEGLEGNDDDEDALSSPALEAMAAVVPGTGKSLLKREESKEDSPFPGVRMHHVIDDDGDDGDDRDDGDDVELGGGGGREGEEGGSGFDDHDKNRKPGKEKVQRSSDGGDDSLSSMIEIVPKTSSERKEALLQEMRKIEKEEAEEKKRKEAQQEKLREDMQRRIDEATRRRRQSQQTQEIVSGGEKKEFKEKSGKESPLSTAPLDSLSSSGREIGEVTDKPIAGSKKNETDKDATNNGTALVKMRYRTVIEEIVVSLITL